MYNLRFPGQYWDNGIKLSHNWFRQYDPSTGRFPQSDPIGLNGGLNTYGYVGGNPTLFIDPTGLKGQCIKGKIGESGFEYCDNQPDNIIDSCQETCERFKVAAKWMSYFGGAAAGMVGQGTKFAPKEARDAAGLGTGAGAYAATQALQKYNDLAYEKCTRACKQKQCIPW
ncbi:RHS repeat-associated core domain-containing protein [Chitinivorax sp. B]|uniref:RHS repeat domain-containing protein n=1 Tax=Chitinivorax sp. B TaxID=2502235 RepID=UPI00201761B6|nr:RHS repeat-associated core domain-containing protein [Chitinivorax sp. B]